MTWSSVRRRYRPCAGGGSFPPVNGAIDGGLNGKESAIRKTTIDRRFGVAVSLDQSGEAATRTRDVRGGEAHHCRLKGSPQGARIDDETGGNRARDDRTRASARVGVTGATGGAST